MKYIFWNKEIGINIAYKEGIKLNIIHWRIIYYIRLFYFKYDIFPSIRNIISFLNKKYKINCDSIFLFKLFPKGIIKQSSKIACIPNYVQCF